MYLDLRGGTANRSNAPAFVTLFDLDRDTELLTDGRLSDFQVEQAPPVRGGTIDARRVLMVCALDSLPERLDLLRRIRMSSSVGPTICLVHGRPTDEDVKGPVVLPAGSVEALECPVIWVGDPCGVVWEPGTSRAKCLTVFADDPDGKEAFKTLVSVLRIPQVFDDVVAQAPRGKAVLPALRLLVPGSADDDLIHGAELAAIEELTAVEDGAPAADSNSLDLPLDASLRGELPADAGIFIETGAIGRLSADTLAAWSAALERLRRLRHRPSRTARTAAVAAVVGVADSLEQVRGELDRAVDTIEPSDGIDTHERRTIEQLGLQERVLERSQENAFAEAADETRLRVFAQTRIRRTRSLSTVASELRELAGLVKPRTKAQTRRTLKAIYPPASIDRLRNPPGFVLRAESAGILTLACFGAASVWWPGVWIAVPLLMLVTVALAFAWLTTDWPGWRAGLSATGRAAASGSVLLRAALLLVGAAFGVVVLMGVDEHRLLHPIGIVVAVVALGVYCSVTWQAAVDDWVRSWGVVEVAGTWEDYRAGRHGTGGVPAEGSLLGRLLAGASQIIVNDWLSANTRTEFSQVVCRLADGIESARAALAEAEALQHSAAAPSPAVRCCNPAIRADLAEGGVTRLRQQAHRVDQLILEDHLDAVCDYLDREWIRLTGRNGDNGQIPVSEPLTKWLSDYSRSLREYGLFGNSVGFEEVASHLLSDAGVQRRRSLLHDLWLDLDLAQLLREDDMVLFGHADDLKLLDQTSQHELVRFAPPNSLSARPAMERTSSMAMAGSLKLVPLRTTST